MDDLDLYFYHKKDMGKRFKDFRILLLKSIEELSAETGYPAQKISLLELGAIYPDFQFLDYFSMKYGLSLTWISSGTGPIFYKETEEIAPAFFMYCLYNAPDSEDFAEFIEICANSLNSA